MTQLGSDALLLHEMSITSIWGKSERIDAPLLFRGYCAPAGMALVRGAVVVCFVTRRTGQLAARPHRPVEE